MSMSQRTDAAPSPAITGSAAKAASVGASSSPPLVALEEVWKSFGRVCAVDGVSLALQRGEILALVGPNGAGKTTLLRLIIGMLRPDAGRVLYALDGVGSERPDPTRLGYLPEERGLYMDVPVRRVLHYFAALRGMPRSLAGDEADRWLERLGLGDRAGEEVRSLSKGNQQKVQFITAILHRPTLAVLDEPFAGLDPLNQDFFIELVRELREGGTTVLFSAHQMQLVERMADRVALIRDGRLADEGTLAQLQAAWGGGLTLHEIYVRTMGRPAVENEEVAG